MGMRYLVVGTGRCGTVYMAKLLSSVGVPCGHEATVTPQKADPGEGISHLGFSLCSTFDHLAKKPIMKWVDPKQDGCRRQLHACASSEAPAIRIGRPLFTSFVIRSR
jgi:hypothetical protein